MPRSIRTANGAKSGPETSEDSRGTQARLDCVPDRAVRVAILGINYTPEPTGIAPYTRGLAAGLAQRGYEVTALTGYPHYPYWRPTDEVRRFRSGESLDGVRVRRLKHPIPAKPSWIRRVIMEVTFGLQVLTSRWGRPDVVICVSPPLLATAMAVARARMTWHRPALGVLVHDIYSRGLAETAVAPGLAARAIAKVESMALRLSDGVSVIHTGFADDLAEHLGVDGKRIREIRNWTHVDSSDPSAAAAFREAHHWDADELIILHAGNMGYKQGLENVVAAAKLAHDANRRVRFILLGDGNQREALEEAAKDLPTIQFLPPVPEKVFPAALGAADVLLVNERPGVARMAVPSKLTSYFSAGKPILAATDGNGLTAGELTASGAGVCVPADRPDRLLSEAIRLGSDRKQSRQLGEAGLNYCSNMLSQETALDSYEQWIIDLEAMRAARNGGRGR